MSKKSFKIARKPGQVNGSETTITSEPKRKARRQQTALMATVPPNTSVGQTTRKTIEVPEDYFFRVKMRALERHMKEKELWAEILDEYFGNHPAL